MIFGHIGHTKRVVIVIFGHDQSMPMRMRIIPTAQGETCSTICEQLDHTARVVIVIFGHGVVE